MNDFRCDEAEELVELYVLDALDSEESCAFASHLVECRRHDERLTSMRAVTEQLATAIAPVAPAAGLRASLLTTFDSMVAADRAPVPVAPATTSRRSPLRLSWAYGLAAALLVVSFALGAILLRGGDDSVVVANASQPGMEMKVLYLTEEQIAVLQVELPALTSHQTYQAWQIIDGRPTSLGLLPSSGTAAFKAAPLDATTLAVTIEPAGGSPQPSSAPVLAASF